MSNEKIFLNKKEQMFLMEMFETEDPTRAAEGFSECMIKEGIDPGELKEYLKKVMERMGV